MADSLVFQASTQFLFCYFLIAHYVQKIFHGISSLHVFEVKYCSERAHLEKLLPGSVTRIFFQQKISF